MTVDGKAECFRLGWLAREKAGRDEESSPQDLTDIVSQDGKVFQRNFGEKTSQLAGAMKEYNPGSEWTLVQDEGVSDAVSHK